MKKKSIVWLAEAISPYNNFLFNKLKNEDDFEFYVYYRYCARKTHYWRLDNNLGYSYRYFLQPRIIPDVLAVWKCIFKDNSLIVFSGTKGITKTLILILSVLFKKRFIYWTDVPHPKYLLGIKGFIRKQILKLIFIKSIKVLVTGTPGIQRMKSFGCLENKMINFPYFIPISKLRESKIGTYKIDNLYKKSITLLASGRYNYSKGFDVIIKALKILKHSYNIDNFTLLISGEGTYRQALESMIIEFQLSDKIKLVGWLQQDELIEFYNSGDIFIHMSRYEPFGVVVLEAMSFGKPIIGSNTTMAVLDRVIDGENGFIIENENHEKLAEKLKYFYENRNMILQMGKAARNTSEIWPVERGVKIIQDLVTSAQIK